MPGNDLTFWTVVLGLEIGDRVTVEEQPPGFAAPLTADYHIQGVAYDFADGPLSQARFRFSLMPVDSSAWMIFDDATAGKFDSARFGY